jgi:hypothetical protein
MLGMTTLRRWCGKVASVYLDAFGAPRSQITPSSAPPVYPWPNQHLICGCTACEAARNCPRGRVMFGVGNTLSGMVHIAMDDNYRGTRIEAMEPPAGAR